MTARATVSPPNPLSNMPIGLSFMAVRLWGSHQVARDLVDGAGAGQGHGQLELGLDATEHPLDAAGTAGRQPPQHGPPQHHATRTQGESPHHVHTATDAAVDEHLPALAHRRHDRGQGVGRRNRAVELATAVIGHAHAGRAGVEAGHGVVVPQHALDDHRQTGQLVQPPDALEGDTRVLIDQASDRGARLEGRRADVGREHEGIAYVAHPTPKNRRVAGEHERG